MEITNNATPLARLLDETAIRDTIARFADAATSGDSDGFRTLWADDAQWVIGSTEGQPFESRSKGIDEIVSHFRELRDDKEYFIQFAAPGSIDISGDDATVRCLCY
jgi:ketosteroid isomerase-like protein